MDNPPAGALTHWDAGETLADRFRAHAGDAEHLYGYAVRGMAQDWEIGGPVRMACSGYEDAPRGSVIHLRLLAGVFRLVLTGRAQELVAFYPCLGGSAAASGRLLLTSFVWPFDTTRTLCGVRSPSCVPGSGIRIPAG